jgi:hypothetical protein
MKHPILRPEKAGDSAAGLIEDPFADRSFQGFADDRVIITELDDENSEPFSIAVTPMSVDHFFKFEFEPEMSGKSRLGLEGDFTLEFRDSARQFRVFLPQSSHIVGRIDDYRCFRAVFHVHVTPLAAFRPIQTPQAVRPTVSIDLSAET